jgi:hypothetical protein
MVFLCELCGQTFPESWTEADAEEEFRRLFPHVSPNIPRIKVCDDCFQMLLLKGIELKTCKPS